MISCLHPNDENTLARTVMKEGSIHTNLNMFYVWNQVLLRVANTFPVTKRVFAFPIMKIQLQFLYTEPANDGFNVA